MQEVYNSLLDYMCILKHASNNAMVLCQSWGYNGHKRKYEEMTEKVYRLMLELEKEMFDEQGLVAPLSHSTVQKAYQPAEIKDHSFRWLAFIRDTCGLVAELNKKVMELSGKQSKWVCKLLKCLYKEKEKAARWIVRGDAVGWMEHDLRRQDDRLHKKYKKRQKEKRKKWN